MMHNWTVLLFAPMHETTLSQCVNNWIRLPLHNHLVITGYIFCQDDSGFCKSKYVLFPILLGGHLLSHLARCPHTKKFLISFTHWVSKFPITNYDTLALIVEFDYKLEDMAITFLLFLWEFSCILHDAKNTWQR